MVLPMRTATPDVHGRISALIRADARNGSEWATLLGLGRQALHDRLKGRTRWTLRDAMTIAATLGTTVDTLVGDEDLELGYALLEAEEAELPELPAGLEPEEVLAEVVALRLVQTPAEV